MTIAEHLGISAATQIAYLAAPKPGDVIVIACPDESLSAHSATRMGQQARLLWPNNKIAVVREGVTIHVEAGG